MFDVHGQTEKHEDPTAVLLYPFQEDKDHPKRNPQLSASCRVLRTSSSHLAQPQH